MPPRHRWEPTGLVTTGRYGGVRIWKRCEWCGQVDDDQRRRRLDPCCGPKRPERAMERLSRRWVAITRGVPLPLEPAGGFPRVAPAAAALSDDRDAAVPREGALPPAPVGAFPRA